MKNLEKIQSKILNSIQLSEQLQIWQAKNFRIAFTNGCFDILHRGHVDYLAKAKDTADILVLGLNTDESVRLLKGAHRPINDEQSRALIMASLYVIDAVVLFDEDTPYNLIKTVQPDILIKGSDYKPENIIGYDIVTAKGGKVLTIDFIDGFSTSAIEAKIKQS